MTERPENELMQKIEEKICTYITDEKDAQRLIAVFQVCRNDREREFLCFRYGLEDGVPKTLQEAADRFGMTRERASLIESTAIRKSSPRLRRRKSLTDYLDE